MRDFQTFWGNTVIVLRAQKHRNTLTTEAASQDLRMLHTSRSRAREQMSSVVKFMSLHTFQVAAACAADWPREAPVVVEAIM